MCPSLIGDLDPKLGSITLKCSDTRKSNIEVFVLKGAKYLPFSFRVSTIHSPLLRYLETEIDVTINGVDDIRCRVLPLHKS